MKAKPVQIAIIVIGLIVGVVGIVMAMRSNAGPDLADKMILVDVKTGELFAISTKGRSILLPYRHPVTNEPTLLPAGFDESESAWYLKSRYLGAVGEIAPASDIIDARSGRVSIGSEAKPKAIK